ncbi:hypothetical protein [Streptomyces rimosus]|uniref:hypothetical protein n=1 Tax=Streptomyces rimosus TaxID=1927 RepID=UPI00131BC8CF|nr:hypothetical protein [Streptomyces rimosus]
MNTPAGFSCTFRPAPNIEVTFHGETPMTVGPNVEAFAQAAPRYADLLGHAQAAFTIGELGATVISTTSK